MEQIRLVFVVLVLLFSVFAMLVVPFPITVPSSKSNVADKKVLKTVAHILDKERLKKVDNNPYKSTLDDPETTMSMSNLGLRLFPDFTTFGSDSQLDSHGEQPKKTPLLRFFPNPQEPDKQGGQGDVGKKDTTKEVGTEGDSEKAPENVPEDDLEGYEKTPHVEGDDPKPRSNDNEKIGGRMPPTYPTEKTVAIPKFKTDYLGNWVYNPWGVTYGQVFRDTRFIGLAYSGPVVHIDRHTKLFNPDYVPTKDICKPGRSTAYHTPYIKQYLKVPFYHSVHPKGVILVEVRKEIYEKGNSEECHTPKQLNWRLFNECMMMRNMRMEFLVPYYPLHQTTDDFDYNTDYAPSWPLDDNPLFDYYGLTHKPRWPDGAVTTKRVWG